MKTNRFFLLSVFSGLLFSFAWFPYGFIILLFVAFVPLLLIEQTIFQNPQKYKSLQLLLFSYLAFFIWNILTTWWIKNASFGGAIMAIVCNALLMTMTFMLYHGVKKRIGEKYGAIVFISFWLAFEFSHHHWDLSWPWLTLGNAFALAPTWIQWYEYSGVFGGSLWILIVNVLVFKSISDFKFQFQKSRFIWLMALLILPILISYSMLSFSETNEGQTKIVIVQPNIDPYNEKFSGSGKEQLEKMMQLALQKVDSTTDYLIFPETALSENIWENELNSSKSLQTLQDFIKQYPRLKIITGASTVKVYQKGEPLSVTARKFTNDDGYYDFYNTALQLDKSGSVQIYHKSKLVPGVEKMPFPSVFKYFEKFAIDLGGTSGSLGIQDERTVFHSGNDSSKAAPVICYESIYGEYVSDYINNGANFISIITNDGWWGDTPGYKQHLKYGALRAIETRKWIARSANTGISCFITPFGEIQQETNWWVPDVIAGKITLNNHRTFYTRFGDYIARIAIYSSLLLLIYSWLLRFRIIKKQ